MQLILTHENADFDAVAAQLAMHKLHPDAVPLLPWRQNRNVSQFLSLYWDALPFTRPEDWRRQQVDRVLLVDTQSLPGVRGLQRDVPVQIVDHHVEDRDPSSVSRWPKAPLSDPTVHGSRIEPVGATTTLLVEIIQQAGLSLTAEEATLLLLGIYEDTGSLVYDSTTERDLRAAAWLLEEGAQMSVVRRFLDVPLTDQQRALYQQLQAGINWLEIEGQPIAFAAVTAPEEFEDEISAVVHRLREALAPAALIVLVELEHHIQLVARSDSDQIDVSELAHRLGGGGHSRAAAAAIDEESLAAAAETVRQALPAIVTPAAKVAEIMSYRVQTLPPTATVGQAAAQMQRYGHEGYPIIEPKSGQLEGLLTRRAVDRAMSHQLEQLPVSDIMKAGAVSVRPSDSVTRVQQLMMEEGWGQIPVLDDDGELLGIVTRTDVLNLLSQPTQPAADRADMRRLMADSLPPPLWELVQRVGEMADELDMPAYFVGGPVRDLLLGEQPTDIDIVVEGDAIKLARRLQKTYGGDIHTHARFGTAKWDLSNVPTFQRSSPEGPRDPTFLEAIDFVTARTEFYRQPSALPEVERGSIKLDLHRRDFTINTLAIRLDGAHLGQLLDFYGGRRDLRNGLIRVLHSLSFIDDPTRILRAVRLEQRLGFAIEARTAELIATALPVLDRVSGDRIRNEIELALREEAPARILERLHQLDVLRHIHPDLTWSEDTAAAFARVPPLLDAPPWQGVLGEESPAFVYFALWLRPIAEREAIMRRLKVRKRTREDVKAVATLYETLQALPADAPPSQVEKRLRDYQPRVLLATQAALPPGPKANLIETYYRDWRHIRPALTGDDLRALGLPPGPRYAELLDRLLAARLDGQVSSEAEERALLETLL